MAIRVLGIDPGSLFTGFGLVDRVGNKLVHVGSGRLAVKGELADRLVEIHQGLGALIAEHHPDVAAIEGVFQHRNAQSALKLGHARGVALLCCRLAGLSVNEYAPALVKQSIVGNGRAEKTQVRQMVVMMLGLQTLPSLDAADALAIAICEAYRSPIEKLR